MFSVAPHMLIIGSDEKAFAARLAARLFRVT